MVLDSSFSCDLAELFSMKLVLVLLFVPMVEYADKYDHLSSKPFKNKLKIKSSSLSRTCESP